MRRAPSALSVLVLVLCGSVLWTCALAICSQGRERQGTRGWLDKPLRGSTARLAASTLLFLLLSLPAWPAILR